jgi:glutamate synthase (NADPH/NADH) large chain
LADWPAALPRFVKVMPHDYKRALAELEAEKVKTPEPVA